MQFGSRAVRLPGRGRWLVIATIVWTSGCAIHYYDAKTGTEHLWGFGHMKMRVDYANEGVCAVARETSTAGVALSAHESRHSFAIGLQRLHKLEVLSEETGIRLDWPTNELFDVRVGTELPPDVVRCERRANISKTRDQR